MPRRLARSLSLARFLRSRSAILRARRSRHIAFCVGVAPSPNTSEVGELVPAEIARGRRAEMEDAGWVRAYRAERGLDGDEVERWTILGVIRGSELVDGVGLDIGGDEDRCGFNGDEECGMCVCLGVRSMIVKKCTKQRMILMRIFLLQWPNITI